MSKKWHLLRAVWKVLPCCPNRPRSSERVGDEGADGKAIGRFQRILQSISSHQDRFQWPPVPIRPRVCIDLRTFTDQIRQCRLNPYDPRLHTTPPGLWTCFRAQEGLRQKRFSGYCEGHLRAGHWACSTRWLPLTVMFHPSFHVLVWFGMSFVLTNRINSNYFEMQSPWHKSRSFRSPPAEFVVWCTPGSPNGAGATWLNGSQKCLHARDLRLCHDSRRVKKNCAAADFFVEGWRMAWDFRFWSSNSGCKIWPQPGCTDIFVHSHHCIGGALIVSARHVVNFHDW